jgi:hypothetical protein
MIAAETSWQCRLMSVTLPIAVPDARVSAQYWPAGWVRMVTA